MTSIEVAVLVAIRALRCLCSIAKGFQAPTESVDDLESGDETPPTSNFPDVAQMHIDIMVRVAFTLEGEKGLTPVCLGHSSSAQGEVLCAG